MSQLGDLGELPGGSKLGICPRVSWSKYVQMQGRQRNLCTDSARDFFGSNYLLLPERL